MASKAVLDRDCAADLFSALPFSLRAQTSVEIDLEEQMAYLPQNGGVAFASPISSGRYGHLTGDSRFGPRFAPVSALVVAISHKLFGCAPSGKQSTHGGHNKTEKAKSEGCCVLRPLFGRGFLNTVRTGRLWPTREINQVSQDV